MLPMTKCHIKGAGISQSVLLFFNKIDLAEAVDADLTVMENAW